MSTSQDVRPPDFVVVGVEFVRSHDIGAQTSLTKPLILVYKFVT